jgi:hypothetical protein
VSRRHRLERSQVVSRPGAPLFVRPSLQKIFDHRRQVIAEIFGS